MNIARRIRLDANKTQEEVATRADVTPQVILRVEQYLPAKIPDRVVYCLAGLSEYDAPDIRKMYNDGRSANIARFGESLRFDPPFYAEAVEKSINHAIDNYAPRYLTPGENRHPFRLFRERLFSCFNIDDSQINFCRLTGLHPATIGALENGATGLSASVRDCLQSVFALSDRDIDVLVRLSREVIS